MPRPSVATAQRIRNVTPPSLSPEGGDPKNRDQSIEIPKGGYLWQARRALFGQVHSRKARAPSPPQQACSTTPTTRSRRALRAPTTAPPPRSSSLRLTQAASPWPTAHSLAEQGSPPPRSRPTQPSPTQRSKADSP